jgi:hypothetical protein
MKRTGYERPNRTHDFKQDASESAWVEYKEEAIANGIGYSTFITRTRSGITPKNAAYTPLKQVHGRHVWVGEYLDTRKGHCKALGINYNTIAGVMAKNNLGFEEAVFLRNLDAT